MLFLQGVLTKGDLIEKNGILKFQQKLSNKQKNGGLRDIVRVKAQQTKKKEL